MDLNNQKIATLNWNVALEYALDNEKFAKNNLMTLLDSFPLLEQQINHLLEHYFFDDEQVNSDLLLLVHKLHSASIYCGAQKLQKICLTTEHQLRDGISAIALYPELLSLIAEFDNIRLEAANRFTD